MEAGLPAGPPPGERSRGLGPQTADVHPLPPHGRKSKCVLLGGGECKPLRRALWPVPSSELEKQGWGPPLRPPGALMEGLFSEGIWVLCYR